MICWMRWGLIGGVIGVLAPLAMGPGLEDTSSIFYFFGIGVYLLTNYLPENFWFVGIWIAQFLLGFLIGAGVGYVCRKK